MDVHLGLYLYQKRKAETETKEGKMKRVQEEIRKGPWTEREDVVLVNFVHLFGDRRWDFIAKVSGLNRTGKSCRLRWVNYLHPGLKRGKMTTQEERLVLELHAKWGNRWSRIAQKLPGRTDNEIKNYWRTHMRKKAQDMKRAAFQRSPSVNSPCSASTITTADSMPSQGTGKVSFYDTGGLDMTSLTDKKREQVEEEKGYSMDDIWKDIDQLYEENNTKTIYDNYSDNVCGFSYPLEASPAWEFCWDSLWRMDEEEGSKINCLTNKDSFI